MDPVCIQLHTIGTPRPRGAPIFGPERINPGDFVLETLDCWTTLAFEWDKGINQISALPPPSVLWININTALHNYIPFHLYDMTSETMVDQIIAKIIQCGSKEELDRRVLQRFRKNLNMGHVSYSAPSTYFKYSKVQKNLKEFIKMGEVYAYVALLGWTLREIGTGKLHRRHLEKLVIPRKFNRVVESLRSKHSMEVQKMLERKLEKPPACPRQSKQPPSITKSQQSTNTRNTREEVRETTSSSSATKNRPPVYPQFQQVATSHLAGQRHRSQSNQNNQLSLSPLLSQDVNLQEEIRRLGNYIMSLSDLLERDLEEYTKSLTQRPFPAVTEHADGVQLKENKTRCIQPLDFQQHRDRKEPASGKGGQAGESGCPDER